MTSTSPAVSALVWTILAFLAGSIPFSVLVGKVALGTDIRRFGDGNPGGTNVARAGGKLWGGIAVFLDGIKAAIPVWLALRWAGVDGLWLVPVALAPSLGHAYSPFLGFRGGKAIAATAGVWLGLITWEGPIVLVLFLLIAYYLIDVDGWSTMAMMGGFGVYLLVRNRIFVSPYPLFEPTTLAFLPIWLGQTALLAWKHRADLRHRPHWRRAHRVAG